MTIRVVDFTKLEKNTMKGFITVAISDSKTGIEIVLPGFLLHEKGHMWVEFPSKQDKTGAWINVIYIYDPIMKKQFKNIILKEFDKFMSQYEENVDETFPQMNDPMKFD
jgi:hypothetical protein